METPLLMAQGTDDGAVEFNQGVEFFNAARRAGKDLAVLVCDGENHGLSREEENSVDYRDRILQWLGHHLKGEAPPGGSRRACPASSTGRRGGRPGRRPRPVPPVS